MTNPWNTSWNPAIGDYVEILHDGSGTITAIEDDRYEVEYDLVASSAPIARRSIASDRETGWHQREEIEPGDRTIWRLRQEQARGVTHAHHPRAVARAG